MRKPSTGSMAASASALGTIKTPCCSKVGLKRGPWTADEDELLANYVKREGEGRWRTLPKRAGLLRCGKSCRLRWMNYLRPSIKRGQIAPDEEDLILRLHRLLGNSYCFPILEWSLIAGRIPGRTDNEIKNYWNTRLSKKLISQGKDPRTHKPLNPNSSGDNHAHTAPSIKADLIIPNPNPSSSCLDQQVMGSCSRPLIIKKKGNNSMDSSGLDQVMGGGSHRFIIKKGSHEYFKGTNMDHRYSGLVDNDDGDYQNWQNSDGFMMDLQRIHGISHGDDDFNYCTDDAFSSFFNSIMVEDLFANQHEQTSGIAPTQNLSHGTEWDADALKPSTLASNEEDEHKQIADHVKLSTSVRDSRSIILQ